MEELLTYSHVDVSFRGNTVVHDVSFSLHKGEILGIVGESGSGKSTLLKAAMGLLGKDGMVRGEIFFQWAGTSRICQEKQLRTICGAGIGMIFQDAGASLSPIRTIGAQIHESIAAAQKNDKRRGEKPGTAAVYKAWSGGRKKNMEQLFF